MKPQDLSEQISIELDLMQTSINEIISRGKDLANREPTMREKAAAATFLAEAYSGVENILIRISHHYEVPLPVGDAWHLDLFDRFCHPSYRPLPCLFDEPLASDLSRFRRFRHLVRHGYSLHLDWSRMQKGVETASDVFQRFKESVYHFMETL